MSNDVDIFARRRFALKRFFMYMVGGLVVSWIPFAYFSMMAAVIAVLLGSASAAIADYINLSIYENVLSFKLFSKSNIIILSTLIIIDLIYTLLIMIIVK